MSKRLTMHITDKQIEAISELYRELDPDWIKERFGVRRFNVIQAAVEAIETPLYNSGKPMHERGRPAQSPYTLPLEARA
jgi:hypothetical protein